MQGVATVRWPDHLQAACVTVIPLPPPVALLYCSSNRPDDAAAGVTQVAVWQQNAAAWAERLGRQHPLYRDVVQVGTGVSKVPKFSWDWLC